MFAGGLRPPIEAMPSKDICPKNLRFPFSRPINCYTTLLG